MRTVSDVDTPWMLMLTLLVSGRHELMFTIFTASLVALDCVMFSRIGTV